MALTPAALLAGVGLLLGATAAHAHSDGMAPMDMGGDTRHPSTSFRFGAPASAAHASRTIHITMGDMSFEPASVTVRPGEVIRFVVINKSAIDHEFTLGDATEQRAHRKEMTQMAEQGKDMDHDDPNAISVKAGETRELTWKFGRGGRVEYDCDVPGHYEAGMRGVIVVR